MLKVLLTFFTQSRHFSDIVVAAFRASIELSFSLSPLLKSAITPSPINLSIFPLFSAIASPHILKYLLSKKTVSYGSKVSEIRVKLRDQ